MITHPVQLSEHTWLQNVQQNQLAAFMQRGFPTRQEERWKYTDMSSLQQQNYFIPQDITANCSRDILPFATDFPIGEPHATLVFINGYFSATLSHIEALPPGVILCSTLFALQNHENLIANYLKQEFDAMQHPFASLNTAQFTDGIFLLIPENVTLTCPIRCIFHNTQQSHFMIAPRNIIILGANSEAILIQEHRGNADHYFVNALTEIDAGAAAKCHFYKMQIEAESATYISNTFIKQEKSSQINHFAFLTGSRLAREDIQVTMQEDDAACSLYGFYHLKNDIQHLDNHLEIKHLAARGTSQLLYKGILDKKAHAVFNGRVFVDQKAKQIQSQQKNHNMLLSAEAEIDTKPELEIYADDVKCSHGATVGQLDAEALFYLRSRGITEKNATAILQQSFAEEIMGKINHPVILNYIQQQVGNNETI